MKFDQTSGLAHFELTPEGGFHIEKKCFLAAGFNIVPVPNRLGPQFEGDYEKYFFLSKIREKLKEGQDLKRFLTEEMRQIQDRLPRISKVQISLRDNQKVECRRLGSRNMPQICPLFLCEGLKIDGKNYFGLYSMPTHANEFGNRPELFLSSSSGLSPEGSWLKRVEAEGSSLHSFGTRFKNDDYDTYVDRVQFNSFLSQPREFIQHHRQVQASHEKAAEFCESPELKDVLLQQKNAIEKSYDVAINQDLTQVIEMNGSGLVNSYFKNGSSQCPVDSQSFPTLPDEASWAKVGNILNQAEALKTFEDVKRLTGIPFCHVKDGCQYRAHEIAEYLHLNHVKVEKIWITGKVYPKGIQYQSKPLKWDFHTAPVIFVTNEKGEVEKKVIDLTLSSDRLLTVQEWISKMDLPEGKVIEVAFPPPSNACGHFRTGVCFSDWRWNDIRGYGAKSVLEENRHSKEENRKRLTEPAI